MVIPIIGAKDYVEPRGFFIHDCPTCAVPRVFSVYDSRRKLTLYFLPVRDVRSQHVMECMTCHAKWAIPDNVYNDVLDRLMTQEELSARVQQQHMGGRSAQIAQSRGRTYYQILQVDPLAEHEVIEVAFKRLALKYHPDRSSAPDAESRMRELLDAKNVLLDPAARSRYDRSIGIVHRIDALRPDDV